jgi:DNA-binding transcriptional regulator YiaG
MPRKTPAAAVREFRQRHGLTQAALDGLLGFSSAGMATGRWEREGRAPFYVSLFMGMIDRDGLDLAKELAEAGIKNTPREEVQAFRERHKLTGYAMDHLFGLSSNGRATRRWEDPLENGAPTYITVMMAYCDKYGCEAIKAALKAQAELDESESNS